MYHDTKINRKNNQLRTWVEPCVEFYYTIAKWKWKKVAKPGKIELDIRNPNRLLFTDYRDNALKYVDIQTRQVGTVIDSGFSRPRQMVWAGNTLLVTNDYYISQVSWANDGSELTSQLSCWWDSSKRSHSQLLQHSIDEQ